jgi:hypothetical protein
VAGERELAAVLDDGKRPAKTVAGETFEVSATISDGSG